MPRGRQPKAIKTVERKVQLPETLDAELQLLLFSEVEQRVPYGALSNLIVPLLQQYVTNLKERRRNVSRPIHQGPPPSYADQHAGSGAAAVKATAAGSQATGGATGQAAHRTAAGDNA